MLPDFDGLATAWCGRQPDHRVRALSSTAPAGSRDTGPFPSAPLGLDSPAGVNGSARIGRARGFPPDWIAPGSPKRLAR